MSRSQGSASERWVRARWPAIRKAGFPRFLLLRGLLLWGGMMFVAMAAFSVWRLGPAHPRLALMLAITALLSAVGGMLWASSTWWINERIFRNLQPISGEHA